MNANVWKRSSHCMGNACVEVGYHKSSHSTDSGNCVEVACRCEAGAVLVRDAKLADSPVLTFDTDAWAAFIDAVKGGGW